MFRSAPRYPFHGNSDYAEARKRADRHRRLDRLDRIHALINDLKGLEGVRDAVYEDSTPDYFDVEINVFIEREQQRHGWRVNGGFVLVPDLRSLSRKVRHIALSHGAAGVRVRSPRTESRESFAGGVVIHAGDVMSLTFYSI